MADEFMELIWENGQVSKRGRSTSPSSFRYSSHNQYSPKAQAMTTNTGEDIHTRKEPRLGIFNSALDLDDCSLMGRKEVAKHAFSLQDHSAELFHSLIGNDMNMFLETATGNNPYYYGDKHITELQIVPEFKDKNSSKPEINASPMEIPELETARINNGQIYKSNSFQQCQRSSAGISKSIVNSKVVPAEDSAGLVPEPASDSRNPKNMQRIRQMANPEDEQSQAPGDESVSSRGASNDLSYSSFKTEGMESPSENNAEDQQVPKSARSGVKRRPTQEVHRISERKRRNKINKKMRELQALIPNSDKVDKVSMLDKAIEFLQTLQLQLKILSLGHGFCMSPMMLPTGMQQIQAPHLGHFSPMSMRMGMSMGMSIGMSSNSAMLGVAGGQVLPMPMQLSVPQPPFIPLVSGGSSAVTPMELMQRSAPLLSSKTQSSIHVCSCKSISLDQKKKKKKKKKREKNQCR